jgi:hypothetical protein
VFEILKLMFLELMRQLEKDRIDSFRPKGKGPNLEELVRKYEAQFRVHNKVELELKKII